MQFGGFLHFFEKIEKIAIFSENFFQQKCHSEKIFRPILILIENINFRANLSGGLAPPNRFEIAQRYHGAFETSKKF